MAGRWLLPPLWFDMCWEIGGFDEYPFPIAVASHGATVEERSVLRQRALPELRTGGIVSGDTLTSEFAAILGQIAKPGLWIEGLWTPDEVSASPVRLLSVAFHQDAILLVQAPGATESTGGDLRISVHANTSVAAAAVQGMPPAPPGQNPRNAVPLSALRRDSSDDASSGADSMLQAGRPSSRRKDPATLLRDSVGAQHYRDGQFTANGRDRTGRQRRSPMLCWFDAFEPDGRYGVSRQERGGYEPEIVLAPLGPADVRAAIENRVAHVRG